MGLEQAGFSHTALVEIDADACRTLLHNRPGWNVIQGDIAAFDAKPYRGAGLVAGGLPCPPFSVAGKQRGEADERNLFPAAFRIIQEVQPKAVMIENVRGLLDKRFDYYRELIRARLGRLGYETRFELVNAADFGVPQNRPRVFIIGLLAPYAAAFAVPKKSCWTFPLVMPCTALCKAKAGEGRKIGGRPPRAWRPQSLVVRKSTAGRILGRRARAQPGRHLAWMARALQIGRLRKISPVFQD